VLVKVKAETVVVAVVAVVVVVEAIKTPVETVIG
jgi:hypothetical protein